MTTKIVTGTKALRIDGLGGGVVRVSYDNLGEPYREGVSFDVVVDDSWCSVLMDATDVRLLRDKLTEFLGESVACLRRYDIATNRWGEPEAGMDEDATGDWVKWDDVRRILSGRSDTQAIIEKLNKGE